MLAFHKVYSVVVTLEVKKSMSISSIDMGFVPQDSFMNFGDTNIGIMRSVLDDNYGYEKTVFDCVAPWDGGIERGGEMARYGLDLGTYY